MNKGINQRNKIFNKYAENLKLIMQSQNWQMAVNISGENEILEDKKIYLCPLCAKGFSEECLIQGQPYSLTIEHVPPASVSRNSVMLLTCHSCNSGSGSHLDIHLSKQLAVEPFLKMQSNSKVDSIFTINGITKVRGELTLKEGKIIHIKFKPNSNPKAEASMIDLLQNWDGGKLGFKFEAANLNKYRIALLRVAYLKAFYYFGYSMLFNPNMQKIRKQIENPLNSEFPNFKVFDTGLSDECIGVHLIKEPRHIGILVVFKLTDKKLKYDKNIGIILPAADEISWKNYVNLSKLSTGTELV